MPGPPRPCGAEGLVQVHVHDVRAELGGMARPTSAVEIRAVHVNLPAMRVDDAADFRGFPLEHAVGRGIGDHQGGEVVLVLLRFRAQVVQVHVAVVVAGGDDDLHAAITAEAGLVAMSRRRGSGRSCGGLSCAVWKL